MVNTKNAHVRSAPATPEQDRTERRRLLDDPVFARAFDETEKHLITKLRDLVHNGHPDVDAFEREVCRAIRTLNTVKRMVTTGEQLESLTEKQRQDSD